MKRKILFKGKRVDTLEWVEGFYFFHKHRNKHVILTLIDGVDKFIEVVPETVCQFTTKLQSLNHPMFDDSVKLFEDDIFTVGKSKTKYRVMFDDYEWIGVSNEGDDWGLYKYRLAAIKEPISILVNFHDNPEIFNEAV